MPKNGSFISTTALSDRPLEESYDVELALRFAVLGQIAEDKVKSVGDVGVFLTEKMTELSQDNTFNKVTNKKLFDDTFAILDEVLGDSAFKRFSVRKDRHEGGLLVSLYEVIALGVAYNLAKDTLCEKADIVNRARSVWNDTNFTDWTGAGVTASRRLPKLIPYGRKLFKKT